MMMKKLCRIRLINWHFFVNETINVNGSFLVSGENTSGKSTILDAIQLVLTTNHRRFNTAANEKSSRDLKGYVRCKTGDEGNTYFRTGSVISYVALEFFEEKTSKYFTLGVKIDSPDEESKLTLKWFCEECKLDEITFLTGGRPSINDEFRRNDKKIQTISQITEAKARFGRRLGNLEDRFFDMIPKSLAFKPMDNVKDFINKFILSEKTIEVATLRNNIAMLKELEDLMETTRLKITQLKEILDKEDDIIAKEREIKTNEILIKKAEIESKKIECEELKMAFHACEQGLASEIQREKTLEESYKYEQERLTNLQIAIGKDETTQLIAQTKHRIEMLQQTRGNLEAAFNKFENMHRILIDVLGFLNKAAIHVFPKDDIMKIISLDTDLSQKSQNLFQLKKELENLLQLYGEEQYKAASLLELQTKQKIDLENDIRNLRNKKLTFPENTVKLKAAIEKEFISQGISGEARVFSDLLEITDGTWQNAVEGYLNSQRFYILVEPQHYNVALSVYNRIKKDVHTVGLVNTGKLDVHEQANPDSLAYLIKSENRWAKAYAIYLLNRVIRVDSTDHLKDHKVAITADCMLYQNYAVRKIDEKIYHTPFIGSLAIELQLKNKLKEYEKLSDEIKESTANRSRCIEIIEKVRLCRIDVLEEHIGIPQQLEDNKLLLANEKAELKKAQDNPSYLQMKMQVEDCTKVRDQKHSEYKASTGKIGNLESELRTKEQNIAEISKSIYYLVKMFDSLCEEDAKATTLGINKFNEQVRAKTPLAIVQNFSPLKVGLENKKAEFCADLSRLQNIYCSQYDCDLGSGHSQIDEYIKEHHKLVSSDIIKYDEELRKAKENCEMEFRESFLARLKENIETAKSEFRNLNIALRDIYYGEDCYKFEITHNKKKESIYKMITSNKNLEGNNLWSNSFDEEYKEEMEDLFAKLTAYDDKGEKVLAEYTDYRSYLDYDIIVEKKDGTIQRFSKIYGEKSGGETQTPYYVAIAASFVQLYKLGDTTRIIMFDEAFDKMDDNRISSMMDFLNSQNFQIILATPPSKIEVIGEKVDTILMAMREGSNSIIEEYDL
jgi:uncharacterized protein YPO0396